MPFVLGRRQLLRAGLATAALPGLRSLAFAEGAAAPLLVLVSLRGGMDGLHVLSPADDRHFVEARDAGLRTAAEGDRAGHRLDAVPDTDFRLHREAGPLAAIWREGRMAIWPAAGVPEPTRSHFEAQALMCLGRGLQSDRGGSKGWLASWAETLAHGTNGVTALSAQASPTLELQGMRGGIALSNLAGGLALPGGRFGEAMLAALHGADAGPAALAGRQAIANLRSVDQLLPRNAQGQVADHVPAGRADYARGQAFGRSLAVIAQLARLNPGLMAAGVDLGGWDTHEGQAGRLSAVLRVLANGLAAFDEDMAELPRPWTVLVASEFGRRLRNNRSGGTDHGRAGLIFAFGGGAGRRFGLGRHFGPWPGLAPEALEEGVDLRVATDYRDAFRSVLTELAPAGRPPFPTG